MAHCIISALGVDQTTTLDRAEISSRLGDVVGDALEKRTVTHLQQDAPVFGSNMEYSNLKVAVEIVSIERRAREAVVSFVVFVNRKLVSADDLLLLPYTHISARLQYPVASVGALNSAKETYQSRWWLIGGRNTSLSCKLFAFLALIAGSGALILLCGWILLVVYFNTCGALSADYEPRKYNVTPTHKDREVSERVRPRPVQPRVTSSSAELDDDEPEQPAAAGETREKTKSPEVEFKDIRDVDDHEEAKDKKTTEEPIEAEFEKESDRSGGEEPSPGTMQNETVIPLSDEEVSECERRLEKRRLRPMSAAPRRPLRTIEGSIIEPIQSTKQQWNPYRAGDEVAQIFYIGPTLNGHPTPAPTTERGVVVLRDIDETKSTSSKPFNVL
uniref:Transmembrane protein n=1 Tax=Steinernema glaseri TaxID=37863 RepID=A0A1I7Y3R8_9BILA